MAAVSGRGRRGRWRTPPSLAYGHVFVLLAAWTAGLAGHPDADRLLADIMQAIEDRFWDDRAGLLRDGFTRDRRAFSGSRGLNANMHGVEAFLAAYQATGEGLWLERAGRILGFFIDWQAASHGWRIPEHYDADWRPDPGHEGDPMLRPAGTTPGRSFEMARLVLRHGDLAGRPAGDAPARARMPVRTAAGAAAGDETWYRQLWRHADGAFIDQARGGWFPQTGRADGPGGQFVGKPDICHAPQADLFPLAPGLSRHGAALAATRPLES